MKTNFTSKNAKSLRVNANNEGKGMNHAIKAIKAVWERETNDVELRASIEAAKSDGLTLDSFTAQFIIDNLNGSNFCKEGVIGSTKKGEFVAKTSWTPGQVVDYVRRANKARLESENKKNEESK